MKKLAVFVSGSGTNLQAIMDACGSGRILGQVALVVTDRRECYGVKRAERENIPVYFIEKEAGAHASLLQELEARKIELIVLAGFLSILPKALVEAYPRKIINLHPSLIPKYCGKGFYGDYVHEMVLKNKESVSGITIHYVDEGIDSGEIIVQKKVQVKAEDTVETLRARIHDMEHKTLVCVVERLCMV